MHWIRKCVCQIWVLIAPGSLNVHLFQATSFSLKGSPLLNLSFHSVLDTNTDAHRATSALPG